VSIDDGGKIVSIEKKVETERKNVRSTYGSRITLLVWLSSFYSLDQLPVSS
jgi:hypothetical protein